MGHLESTTSSHSGGQRKSEMGPRRDLRASLAKVSKWRNLPVREPAELTHWQSSRMRYPNVGKDGNAVVWQPAPDRPAPVTPAAPPSEGLARIHGAVSSLQQVSQFREAAPHGVSFALCLWVYFVEILVL